MSFSSWRFDHFFRSILGSIYAVKPCVPICPCTVLDVRIIFLVANKTTGKKNRSLLDFNGNKMGEMEKSQFSKSHRLVVHVKITVCRRWFTKIVEFSEMNTTLLFRNRSPVSHTVIALVLSNIVYGMQINVVHHYAWQCNVDKIVLPTVD
jgi:hypothetical protein